MSDTDKKPATDELLSIAKAPWEAKYDAECRAIVADQKRAEERHEQFKLDTIRLNEHHELYKQELKSMAAYREASLEEMKKQNIILNELLHLLARRM